jgi:hypothetical protein
MDQPLIHDADSPDGRPATDDELAAILGRFTAADGTNYLDLFNATREDQP